MTLFLFLERGYLFYRNKFIFMLTFGLLYLQEFYGFKKAI